MKIERRDLPQLAVAKVAKGDARTQVAALCWRMTDGAPEVLLITSRETGRWVLPKGWPMPGKSAAEAAEQEAWEEAGVEGKLLDTCLGLYAYHKVLDDEKDVPCIVAVYPLKVKSISDKFPERGERKRRWFSPRKAARRVDEAELKELLKAFDPKALKG